MEYREIPNDLELFLKKFSSDISLLLNTNLHGVYLYGSLSYGDFELGRSDIDVIVLTKDQINTSVIESINRFVDSKQSENWFKSLEVDFISIDSIKSNTISTIRISGGKLNIKALMHGASIDINNLRNCGIVLSGESPNKVIPKISVELIRDALKDKLNELKTTSDERSKSDLWNQMFLVIQLCRVIYSLRNNYAPISKRNAAKWCIENLPTELSKMASTALSATDNFYGPVDSYIAINCKKMIDYAEQNLHKK